VQVVYIVSLAAHALVCLGPRLDAALASLCGVEYNAASANLPAGGKPG